jgi:aerobic-type carbon monoxide dehydrogenase small subunit (CoxS/CutS family)
VQQPHQGARQRADATTTSEDLSDGSATSVLAELTAFLSLRPTATAKLLAQHVDDGSGHCRACAVAQRGHQVWPCTIYAAAARASRRDGF